MSTGIIVSGSGIRKAHIIAALAASSSVYVINAKSIDTNKSFADPVVRFENERTYTPPHKKAKRGKFTRK